jgi:hypothetical protein
MNDTAETNPNDRIAIQALAGAMGTSMKNLAVTAETQQLAILGIAAILACLPETARIPHERLTAALALVTQGRGKEFAEKLANFMATGVATARQIPELADRIKAANATKN